MLNNVVFPRMFIDQLSIKLVSKLNYLEVCGPLPSKFKYEPDPKMVGFSELHIEMEVSSYKKELVIYSRNDASVSIEDQLMQFCEKYPKTYMIIIHKAPTISLSLINQMIELLENSQYFRIEAPNNLPHSYKSVEIFSFDKCYWHSQKSCSIDCSRGGLTLDHASLIEFFQENTELKRIKMKNYSLLNDELLKVMIINNPKCKANWFENNGQNYTQKLLDDWKV